MGRKGVHPPQTIVDPGSILHEMRLFKTVEEVALMQRAADIAAEAHREAMRAARPGAKEYEIEALIEYVFRKNGALAPAYGSIVGAGANATILHYVNNDAELKDGDLLLVDAGAEYEGYASDITRTFPVSGRFSEAQRDVYQLVLDCQEQCIRLVAPGVTLDELHERSVEILTEGMVRLGLLAGDVKKLIEEEAYKKFYMHRLGHYLGMDVHDVGAYHADGQPRPVEPGIVLTVEPGLYISAEAEGVPERYRGIGVRVEDDVLVTPAGHRILTDKAPKQIQEIEALMARLKKVKWVLGAGEKRFVFPQHPTPSFSSSAEKVPDSIPPEEDGVVDRARLEAAHPVEALRALVLLVGEEAQDARAREQLAAELRHVAAAQRGAALVRVDVDAFEVDDFGRVGLHVGLEDEPAVADHHPRPALLDAAQAAADEPFGVDREGVDAALGLGQLGLHGRDQIHFRGGRGAQPLGLGEAFDGPPQLEQNLAAGVAHPPTLVGVVVPELLDRLDLPHDHVRARADLRDQRELGQRPARARLDERVVADEGHAFEPPLGVAAAVERAAVVLADHPVVADQAGHADRVHGPLGEEREHLGAVAFGQLRDRGREFGRGQVWALGHHAVDEDGD